MCYIQISAMMYTMGLGLAPWTTWRIAARTWLPFQMSSSLSLGAMLLFVLQHPAPHLASSKLRDLGGGDM